MLGNCDFELFQTWKELDVELERAITCEIIVENYPIYCWHLQVFLAIDW